MSGSVDLGGSDRGHDPSGSDPRSSEGVRPHGSDPEHATIAGLVRERAWSIAVWAAMIAWSAALFAVVRDHFVNYRLARYDLGNMVQAVWSTAEGRPLEITHGTTGEQIVRLGGHVDPILAALAPLWIVVPSPLTLVAVQVGAVALGALPVFWLGRRHLGSERTAALVALAYLAYPWIAWTAVDAFHPVTLAIPALLFAVWFLDSDRLLPFAVCAVLAFATGELMGVVVAALGVWYAVARRRRRAGIAIAAAGVGWTFVALYAIVPRFSGGESAFYGFYEDVGGSPWGIVRTTLTDPVAILSAVGQGRDLLYVFLLGAPVAFAFLLAPGLAAVALPQLAANHLADLSSATDPHAHYVAGILPFFFAAIAVGLGRLSPTGRVRGAILVLTLSSRRDDHGRPLAVGGRRISFLLPPGHTVRAHRSGTSSRRSHTRRRACQLDEPSGLAPVGQALRVQRAGPRPSGVGRSRVVRYLGTTGSRR